MSFNVALSGIAAAQADLDTTANNIANVNTVGFKESRAEFESVYANSLFSNSKTKTGDGASVAAVAQQFHQGSLKYTQNPLDLAITGNGFFATSSGVGERDLSYTRAGTFKLNNENFIVDNSGNYLQAFPVNKDGGSSSVSLSTTQPIQIPETAGTPVPTSEIGITLNLPAGDEAKDLAKFDPKDPETYNSSTSVTIYDSLGESHIASTYYIKPENASYTGTSQWVTFVTVDDKPVDAWDAKTGQVASGTYGKDINSDGEADTLENLNASLTKLAADVTTTTTAAAASQTKADASQATADQDVIDAKTAADAAAADPTDVALKDASVAAANKSTASQAVAAKDAAIASVDAQKKADAIKLQADVTELLASATTGGVNGSAAYIGADGIKHTGVVLTFDAVGGYKGSVPESLTFQSLGVDDPTGSGGADGAGILAPGADGSQRLTLNFNNPTQFAAKAEVTSLEQNGLTVGRLTGVEIGDDGLVKATYSNGTSQPLSRVAIVRFRNEQGLAQTGNSWIASQNSGDPIAGEANSGSFGGIKSAALEQSNVNLTTELVDLISAQRNFQANSRALEINNTLQQTILQIR